MPEVEPIDPMVTVRVALLRNAIPAYGVALFSALKATIPLLRIFVSAASPDIESQCRNLDIVVQRSLRLPGRWRHPTGFADVVHIDLPYDTILRLWRYQPGIVISGELGIRTLLAFFYKIARPRVRFVIWAAVSEHTEQNRGWARGLLRRVVLPRADALLVNGASGAQYVVSHGVSPARLVIAPYPTDVSFASAPLRRASREPSVLLYVGQLIERKGLLPFLEVLRMWTLNHPERRIELRVAGDGPLRVALQEFVPSSNLVIQFLGPVRYADLANVYSCADIFVFPTLSDEWGIVTNEAMAAGVPVLGSIFSQSVTELVTDGETGWTYVPGKPSELYATLDTALHTSGDRLFEMRKQARDRALTVSPTAVASSVVDGLRRVFSASSREIGR